MRKKIKEESPYLASPVGGWGLVWVAWWRWPPRCAVAEDPAGVWWSWSWFLVTLWTLSCLTRSLMTFSISSMTPSLVVPFHCGILDNDRPEQCCCFIYWQTARVLWLGHATSVSSFLHRTLRKAYDARRNIDHVRLLAYPWGWARFAVTDLVGRSVRESREISNRSSSGVDKTGWNVMLG